MVDYGHAIKDLAATNIFPGDMLLKNFGVTRHGRVVFYDYDELCLLTDCHFRRLPQPRDDEDELAAEPWFYVARTTSSPRSSARFLGPAPGELLAVFLRAPRRAAHARVLAAACRRAWSGARSSTSSPIGPAQRPARDAR